MPHAAHDPTCCHAVVPAGPDLEHLVSRGTMDIGPGIQDEVLNVLLGAEASMMAGKALQCIHHLLLAFLRVDWSHPSRWFLRWPACQCCLRRLLRSHVVVAAATASEEAAASRAAEGLVSVAAAVSSSSVAAVVAAA